MTKFTVEDYENVLDFLCDLEMTSTIYWHGTKEEGFVPYFECSDVFFWGCSDGESFTPTDIPDIEQALRDCEDDVYFGSLLWICRKRKMRPQGALYHGSGYENNTKYGIPIRLRKLFNACGPHRLAELGNPYATPED